MRKPRHTAARSGFTLIELSIVLVIIGLIVGGVLVGRDMIRAAELRNTISAMDRYKAATYTFRTKYNGIPGDIANPSRFGLPCSATRNGSFANSDGNGILDTHQSDATVADRTLGGEALYFWKALKYSKLTGDNVDLSCSSYNLNFYANQMGTDALRAVSLPQLKNGYLTVFHAYTHQRGSHFFALGNFSTFNGTGYFSSTAHATYPARFSLTPLDAAQIDGKLDDGIPRKGTVIATEVDPPLGWPLTPSASGCIVSTTAYNAASSTYANSYLCALIFSAGF